MTRSALVRPSLVMLVAAGVALAADTAAAEIYDARVSIGECMDVYCGPIE